MAQDRKAAQRQRKQAQRKKQRAPQKARKPKAPPQIQWRLPATFQLLWAFGESPLTREQIVRHIEESICK